VDEAEGVSQRMRETIGCARLEAQGDDVVHLDRFSEEVSGGKFGLLYGRGGGIYEHCAT